MQVWDTAGQERYRSITQTFYKNALGVLVVFDLSNKQSFYELKNWMSHIKTHVGDETCKLLVGNKCDKLDSKQVTNKERDDFLDEFPMEYIESSAKDGINIDEAFLLLTKNILEKFYKEMQSEKSELISGDMMNSDKIMMSSKASIKKGKSLLNNDNNSCGC